MKSYYQLKVTGFCQESIRILRTLTLKPELFAETGQIVKDAEGRQVTYQESIWSYTSYPFSKSVDAYSDAKSTIAQNWKLLDQASKEAKIFLVFIIDVDPNERQNDSWEIDNNFQRLLWEIGVKTIYRIDYQQV